MPKGIPLKVLDFQQKKKPSLYSTKMGSHIFNVLKKIKRATQEYCK
jgi:hypothetical protein